MSESPVSSSPYEVLGVGASAGDDELRRAYRRRLRETHPDTGGTAEEFRAVQDAWQRIGTPAARADYDRGLSHLTADVDDAVWSTSATQSARRDTRPRSRSYGHPGGWRREQYLTLMREWIGVGETLDDPYAPALVRSAPYEIRHALADALAEEATARALADLGIGYTVWHDVAAFDGGKIDHVVLGPTGLFAIGSEDFGGAVEVSKGELVGPTVEGRPAHELTVRARHLGRALGVKIEGTIVVLPDAALDDPVTELGRSRGTVQLAAQRSVLAHLLRQGVPNAPRAAGTDLFEVRTRLQQGIRFV